MGSRRSGDTTLDAGGVAVAVQGRLVSGDPTQPVSGFSIDTRSLSRGDLFFAIRGARFDGHHFLAAALHAGACGAVVSRLPAAAEVERRPVPPVWILVDDVTEALQRLATDIRRASGARVVAITGSTGKTTTKEATAQVLGTRYRVFRNKGNLNNHIGLPLSLLELRHQPEIAVVELGMNRAGEIRALVGIAEPDVRVWTNVAEVHLEFFSALDAIADAKAEILEEASPEMLLIANADDPLVMARVPAFAGRVTTFGMSEPADVSAWEVQDLGLDGIAATVRTPVGTGTLRISMLGRGNLANVLAATAVALRFDVPLGAVLQEMAELRPLPRRGEVWRLPGGVTLVDDSYNSNPRALEGALAVVARETSNARRIGILGEMLELGPQSVALHERCGRAAAAAELDWLITVGGAPARALGVAAAHAGVPASRVVHVSTSEEAAEQAMAIVRPGDLVLVKGSRGVATDRVADRLKAEFG